MSVGGNSSQNRALGDQKRRSAGRQEQNSPEQEAVREFQGEDVTKPVGGAHGHEDMAHRTSPTSRQSSGQASNDVDDRLERTS